MDEQNSFHWLIASPHNAHKEYSGYYTNIPSVGNIRISTVKFFVVD